MDGEPTDDWRDYKKAEPKGRDRLTHSKGQTAMEAAAAQVDE